jgi:hypothetical protein
MIFLIQQYFVYLNLDSKFIGNYKIKKLIDNLSYMYLYILDIWCIITLYILLYQWKVIIRPNFLGDKLGSFDHIVISLRKLIHLMY